MAIAKICSVSGNSFAVLAYAIEQKDKKLPEEQKAEIIQANNLFGDIKDMSNQMAMFQEDRPNCKNNVLHLALSFDPNERLTAMQAEKVINTLLEEVGITKADHQYVVVEHKDAAHQHFHIVASRVGMDGSLLSDSHLKVRLNVICDKIEKEQGLLPTPGRQWQYDPSSEKGYKFVKVEKEKVLKNDKNPKIKDAKAEIRKELESVLSKKEIQTPDQLLQALKVKGIEVKFSENKNGISGVSFRTDDIAVKGSAVGYKWSDINKALETNKVQIQAIPAPIGNKAVETNKSHRQAPKPTEKDMREMLATKQYNEGFKGIISDFNVQAEKGNAHFDLDQMIRHNLRNVQNDPILTEYLNNDVPELKKKHQDLVKEFNEYKQRERDFEMLMLRERKKNTLLTALQGKNAGIELSNQELERKKSQTPKPEFKPQTRLYERNFEKTSTFSKTLNSWNDMQHARDLSAKMKERMSPSKTQNPEELKKSKGRGL